jgi:microcystin-dependent protein
MHQLTIAEMPAHNHGVAGGGQGPLNNSTSRVSTSITFTDPGHAHSYNAPNPIQLAATTGGAVDVGTVGATTGTGYTGITLNDPTHAHTLNPAGSNYNHNNVQPTLFMGNMFIYSGRVNYPSFLTGYPYTIGKNIY